MKTVAILAISCTLAACASTPSTSSSGAAAARAGQAAPAAPVPLAARAQVNLGPASGSLVSGRLQAMPMGDGVHFTGDIGGLPPGSTHAIHIHEKGDCSAADAASAGGHFNPRQQPHGRVDQGAHHAGDMDNVVADAQGVAHVNVHAQGVSLGGGDSNILGRAVVVHGAPDDYRTQPAGNAGTRVACGVIVARP